MILSVYSSILIIFFRNSVTEFFSDGTLPVESKNMSDGKNVYSKIKISGNKHRRIFATAVNTIRLTFRELEPFTGFLLSVFFPFNHTRVARHQIRIT